MTTPNQTIAWTSAEIAQAVQALNKIGFTCQNGGRIPSDVFFALCENTNTTPVELAIVCKTHVGNWKVLMSARLQSDRHFPAGAWHMPGTVIQPFENADMGLKRLFANEVGTGYEAFRDRLTFVASQDVPKGSGPGECLRGPEVNRLYLLELTPEEMGTIPVSDGKKFFNLFEDVPENTLEHHKTMLALLRKHLAD